MKKLHFIDSTKQLHKIPFAPDSYPSLMDLIFDKGFEDWGDCKGRAWCGTCHIEVEQKNHLLPERSKEEQKRLDQLSNTVPQSRLACCIPLKKTLDGLQITFIGDD